MRRSALAAALGATLFASTASAQPAEDAVADVPAGPAAIRGVVVEAERETPVPGVEVVLYALSASGVPGVRRAESGPDGRFVFEAISSDPETVYLVGGRYRGIPFPGERIAFEPGELERSVRVEVSEPSEATARVEVVEVTLRLLRAGGRVEVTETHHLRNPEPRALYVPPERRAPERAGFRARLPEGAEEFSMPLGLIPEGLERAGDSLAFYGPFYPGDQDLRFTYTLPATGESLPLRKVFPSGAPRVRLLLPPSGIALARAGTGFENAGEVEVEGRRLHRFDAGAVEPGGALSLRLELPEAVHDPDALRLLETRVFLELDRAALLAREEHRFAVDGSRPLVAPDSQGVLEIPLPETASEVRFSPNALELGLARSADDRAALLRGPLPAGESTVELLYRVPVEALPLVLERSFARSLPLLSVFVADTGVRVESERLHRRRPVRAGDRAYLHLEAFQVEPHETVRIRLAPLEHAGTLPSWARVALVLTAAAAGIAFLIGPLRQQEPGPEPASFGDEDRREEREIVFATLRDLEHDREMGKLADADYQALRRELRAKATALLRAEQEATAARPAAAQEKPPPHCTACGTRARPGDRFCASCGTRLAAPDAEAPVPETPARRPA